MSRNQPAQASRMTVAQWQRADFIVAELKAADQAGKDIATCRTAIKRSTEAKFSSCHDCLLLAVYGLYKNGYIANTNRSIAQQIDSRGFNGSDSLDIKHAFDALGLLKKNGGLSATALRLKLGGDQSIYSFVVHYFNNGLIRPSVS